LVSVTYKETKAKKKKKQILDVIFFVFCLEEETYAFFVTFIFFCPLLLR